MKLFTKNQKETSVRPIVFVDIQSWKEMAKGVKLENEATIADFSGKGGQILKTIDQKGQIETIYAGTSFKDEDPRNWITLFAKLSSSLPEGTYKPEGWPDDKWYQAGLGWGLGRYEFDRYKKEKKELLKKILLVPEEAPTEFWQNSLNSVVLARDLINTPASDMGPEDLVRQAAEVANRFQAQLRTVRGEDLLLEGFPAVYAVGKGSERAPVLMDLRWGQKDHPKLTLVGKGVVFDTGGLNLKPAAGMRNMKKDMGGGAVSLALASLIMAEKLPVNLRLLIPAVENSPGMRAYRPGDVLETRKKITVEVGNTDAEGRLILCDALTCAAEEEPDLILDFSTLTGAARVALGQDLPPFYTPDSKIAHELFRAAEIVGDPLWQMPLWGPYRKSLKSDIADLSNVSNSPLAGSITAALFLYEFVKPAKNWVHFDIFGWRNSAMPGFPKGAEANALRAVFKFLANRYPH
ncbi:MAG: leucyl aminopeptidase [Acidobacteria bacterium]|nr:MAG: leucyl aminopeptidase [Acidobacteriota bacterium]